MKQIYTTTLRLNLADEDDRRAYEHLQQMDKKQYRSYSKAIVTAINDHFERQERLASDPYLETREKEDAFLNLIKNIIEKTVLYNSTPLTKDVEYDLSKDEDDEELSAALDFADNF